MRHFFSFWEITCALEEFLYLSLMMLIGIFIDKALFMEQRARIKKERSKSIKVLVARWVMKKKNTKKIPLPRLKIPGGK